LLVYKTAEGHSCNQKAVELLGLGSDNIRIVPTDEHLRMIPVALEQMLARDIGARHVPVAVVASAGTVNTGAIDPLEEIADVCAEHRVWMHVDAAYGGGAIISSDYGPALRALARADSLALDPHKWMYVPVDAGLVLVRNGDLMRSTFSLVPPYLRTDDNLHGVQGPPWLAEYGAEQTRPFRALKIWMTVRYFGVQGYKRLVDQDIVHARYLAELVEQSEEFELWKPASLSVVCFRYRPSALDDGDAVDSLNRRILEDVQLGGKAFLSGTVLKERFWLRACIVNPLATQSDIGMMFDAVRDAALRR
jgi:glutamate/tyrosine decarboxylase-like PLP-dependent enzyme